MIVQIAILHSVTEIELASGLSSGIENVCCPGNDIAGGSGSTVAKACLCSGQVTKRNRCLIFETRLQADLRALTYIGCIKRSVWTCDQMLLSSIVHPLPEDVWKAFAQQQEVYLA